MLSLCQGYPSFSAVADYKPPADETDHLTLTEGQLVQVLDDANAELWLCRLADDHSKQVSARGLIYQAKLFTQLFSRFYLKWIIVLSNYLRQTENDAVVIHKGLFTLSVSISTMISLVILP